MAEQEGEVNQELRIKELEEKAARAETLEAELNKFREKDLNFSRLRNKTEEEKTAMKEKMTEDQKLIFDELSQLRTERDKEHANRLIRREEKVLADLAGEDEDRKKAIKTQLAEYPETTDPEVLERRLRDAALLIDAKRPKGSPLHQLSTNNGYSSAPKKKDFASTPEGAAVFESWFGRPPGIINKKP